MSTAAPENARHHPVQRPRTAEELWGKYCFDYVLDGLFTGPPRYKGPFATNRSTGHLAFWTIGPRSDFYPDGLFACPGGGRREDPELLAGHPGYWWTCRETKVANVNSGHVSFAPRTSVSVRRVCRRRGPAPKCFRLNDAEPRSTDRVGRRARLVAGATPAAREYSEYDDDGCNGRLQRSPMWHRSRVSALRVA